MLKINLTEENEDNIRKLMLILNASGKILVNEIISVSLNFLARDLKDGIPENLKNKIKKEIEGLIKKGT
jgi:hypothetical protein